MSGHFTIDMLPAFIGDALWIEYGNPTPHRVLVDGGLVGTAQAIRERVEHIAETDGRCRLDLLVISHVDADHIEGIIKLLGDPDLPLDVDDIWFNGNDHLPDPDGEDRGEFLGARHGEFLGALLSTRELPWNRFADGRTIYVPQSGALPRTTLRGGMELTLLSPTYDKLVKLSAKWEDEVRKAKLDGASLEQVLEALQRDRKLAPDDDFLSDEGTPIVEELRDVDSKPDHSAANGSSIAFIASYAGRSCLFAADAHSPVLSNGIDRLLAERGEDRLSLSALKLAHHGSDANLDSALLERLDCHRFLVSTNGRRFHHPDRVAIARIIGGAWRGADVRADVPVELLFNYRTDQNTVWDDDELRSQWNYRTTFPLGDSPGLRVSLEPTKDTTRQSATPRAMPMPEAPSDADGAEEYWPNPEFTKTAVRIEPIPLDAETVINTPFGAQSFRGPFYVVAEGSESYGAAEKEFEHAHEQIAPHEWVKRESVRAYRAVEPETIETRIDGHVEATVEAKLGDWIVQQSTGEVMVLKPEDFAMRYVLEKPT